MLAIRSEFCASTLNCLSAWFCCLSVFWIRLSIYIQWLLEGDSNFAEISEQSTLFWCYWIWTCYNPLITVSVVACRFIFRGKQLADLWLGLLDLWILFCTMFLNRAPLCSSHTAAGHMSYCYREQWRFVCIMSVLNPFVIDTEQPLSLLHYFKRHSHLSDCVLAFTSI
jgi:hypothetical protein